MSDHVLKLTPKDKNYLPDRDAAEKARLMLEGFFPYGEQAEISFSENLRFIDAGAYTEKFKCPLCTATTDIDPLSDNPIRDWWWQLSEKLSEDLDINNFSVKMPCCENLAPILNIDFFNGGVFCKI